MKIGILGSGPVGLALAHGFLNEGYEVMLGTSQPEKPKTQEWKQKHPNAQIGSFDSTANFGEILVLAVKGAVASEALKKAGKENLTGKVIIDSTNPIDTNRPPKDGVLHFFTSQDKSLMEELQEEFPKARFVKAFNSVGNTLMYKPNMQEGTPTMLIAGNDKEAKGEVSSILAKFGWDVEDLGTATAAGPVEQMCILWCIPGFLSNSWSHAFKLLRQ